MKKFKYRFEPLLKMREHIEKERQKQLATATKRVREQEGNLENISHQREVTFARQRAIMNQPFSVAEALVVSRYVLRLKRDRIAGEEMLKALRAEEEKKRRILLEASRERKKYEKLEERLHEKHDKELDALMAKDADETAINSFRYRKAQSEKQAKLNDR